MSSTIILRQVFRRPRPQRRAFPRPVLTFRVKPSKLGTPMIRHRDGEIDGRPDLESRAKTPSGARLTVGVANVRTCHTLTSPSRKPIRRDPRGREFSKRSLGTGRPKEKLTVCDNPSLTLIYRRTTHRDSLPDMKIRTHRDKPRKQHRILTYFVDDDDFE